jgi:hypothetical protein
MSINFEALDLRAFVAVVDLEGFHRAAEALNLSQPALSRRIQRLEAAVGAALLERTTRRVALTTVGREFLPLVRRMLEEFDSSLFAMRDVGKQRRGQISLACVPPRPSTFCRPSSRGSTSSTRTSASGSWTCPRTRVSRALLVARSSSASTFSAPPIRSYRSSP